MTHELLDRFTIGDDCWEWIGDRDAGGYGRLGGRIAHRLAYKELVGPIPAGHHLHHRCENRRCVRPNHLEPMAQGDHSRLHGAALQRASQRTAGRYVQRFTPIV